MTWLADAHGHPLEPSPSCAGFLVRFWPPNARGPGTPVRDAAGSAALLLPTHTTAEQFRSRVGNRPGRYVLTQVTATRKPLRAPAAVVVLDAGVELDDAIGTSALATILAAINASEQRTAAAIAQLTRQLDDQRAWIGQQLAALRGSLRDVDARSLAALVGHLPSAATAATLAPPPRTARRASSGSRPTPPPARTPTPAMPPRPPTTPPPPRATTPAPASPSTEQRARTALAEIIAALPPLPRSVFGAILHHGDAAQLAPLLLLAQMPRAQAIAILTTEPDLVAPLQATLAANLELPIDQLRVAWTEPDEQALPPSIRAALAPLTAPPAGDQ